MNCKNKKRIDEVIEQIKEKDNHADILGVTEGEELYKNALYTKIQWRIVRGMCALVAILFFMINETIVLMAKAKKNGKSWESIWHLVLQKEILNIVCFLKHCW